MRNRPILLAFSVFFLLFLNSTLALSEVLMLGDSIFKHRNDGVKRGVEERLGEEIFSLAVSGAKSKEIAEQYYSLVKGETKFEILLDGGGNDILGKASDCKGQMKTPCYELMAEIANNFSELFAILKRDEHIRIYYVTPHYPQGLAGGFENAVDLGTQMMKIVCRDAKIECHVIDVRREMVGKVLDWDGIHPNQAGINILSEKISEAITLARQAS